MFYWLHPGYLNVPRSQQNRTPMTLSPHATDVVLMVPVIDVNWLVYAPFDPGRDFRVDPPNVPQSIGDTREVLRILREFTGGKCILTPHSGTYCRTGYYEGEMLDVYCEAVQGGGELAVHLHEEIKGKGTRYTERDHVGAVFEDCRRRLLAAGIKPVAYRGGHYAYTPFMNELLPSADIHIDLSCSPGLNQPTREAIWVQSPCTGYYLPDNPRLAADGQSISPVFEIPIGCDGEGSAYRNILHIEQSEIDNLQRILAVLVARAKRDGRRQIVHCLFHTGSVGRPEWVERFRHFLGHVPENGGIFVTATEAKAAYDAEAKDIAS